MAFTGNNKLDFKIFSAGNFSDPTSPSENKTALRKCLGDMRRLL